jgi:predicted nucleic acid-binding protein
MRVFLDTNVILDIPLGREGARSSQHTQDLEDAMQIAVAEAVAADVIVTRNLADFSTSPVPAIDPEAFVERFAG